MDIDIDMIREVCGTIDNDKFVECLNALGYASSSSGMVVWYDIAAFAFVITLAFITVMKMIYSIIDF